ncbi:MAG: AroM family protein [Gemmatimonadota bacterium]
MPPRIAFLTIGQTPRTDLVPDLLRWLPRDVEATELGALDGLDAEAINSGRPAAGYLTTGLSGEVRAAGTDAGRGSGILVTRMRDGSQVVVEKEWVAGRLQGLLDSLPAHEYRAAVLLCTGAFPRLSFSGLFVDAQHVVDHTVAALAHGARRLGVLLPLAEQADGFHYRPRVGQEMMVSHASPYEGDHFAAAGRALAGCDVVVMHCMGYTEDQRRRVAEAVGCPVLLARRMVAAAVAQLL